MLYPQPNGAKMIFPSNHHPSQRAPITFRITTPPGLTAVAGGELTRRAEQADGRVTWTYDSEQPLATQLAQLAIGRLRVTFVDSTGPHGLPIRDVVPDDLVASTEQYRKLTADHIAWLEGAARPLPLQPLRPPRR